MPPSDVLRIDDSAAETLHLELFHRDLLVLENYGFISWDRADHTISKGPNFDEVRPIPGGSTDSGTNSMMAGFGR